MRKKKIMIIDDNKDFLEELRETLHLNGYDALAFSEGTSGLEMAPRLKPDLILLDLRLKDKSGFQIAYELKHFRETAHIPIIAMTGFYVEKEHAELMNICGIKTYVIKPFSIEDAIAKIEPVLKERGR